MPARARPKTKMNRCLDMAAALLLTAASSAFAAELPASSVLALFNRIPELPSTAQEATRWVDKEGRLVHPGLLALHADIKAHQQPMNQDPRSQNVAKAMVDDAPAVKAAAEAGEAYSQAQLVRIKAHEAIWREAGQVNQMKIAAYDGVAIGELTGLIERIADSVKSAAAVANCGEQIVFAPGAVCR
jgi:hypothetical protein